MTRDKVDTETVRWQFPDHGQSHERFVLHLLCDEVDRLRAENATLRAIFGQRLDRARAALAAVPAPTCTECGGTGGGPVRVSGDEWELQECGVCGGTGYMPAPTVEYEPCPDCKGTGGENGALCGCGPGVRHVVDCGTRPRPCPSCEGEGYVRREPAPQAEPDRCSTCGSDDKTVRLRACAVEWDGMTLTDRWHTEGADR